MKNLIAAFFVSFFVISSFAQCSSCTMSVTTTDPTDHVVGIGQVLCIQSTGTLTGRVYIQAGGKLCNQGHINNTNILVTAGGQFDNYGTANVDSLLVEGASAVLNNYGTITDDRLAVTTSGVINNNGNMTCNVFGDTAGTFVNNGNLTANQDFYTAAGSDFTNNQSLLVKRDFYNATGGSITTSCMITVQRDWYNQGTITGPSSGCGGFSITGQSLNSGTVGATGHIDLCDAGHPAVGIDANTGDISNVTFCQCTNVCLALGIDPGIENSIAFLVYPNPATDRIQIRLAEEAEAIVTMRNTWGETVLIQPLARGEKEASLNTSSLSSGLYILTVECKGTRTSRKIEIAR